MRAFLQKRLYWLMLLSIIAIFIGQLGRWHWIAELFSHFLLIYWLIFCLAALLCVGWRRWLGASMAAVSALWLLMPFSTLSGVLLGDIAVEQRLIWYNVNISNAHAEGDVQQLLATDADILALAEINPDEPQWKRLHQYYPYGCQHEEFSPFALAIWAKFPLDACEVRFVGDFAYIEATSTKMTIFALHPPPPINPYLANARAQYLQITAERIALIAAQRIVPTIVVGDLNSSAFSPLFRDFTETAQLRKITPNWQLTWKLFGLNIDHALVDTAAEETFVATPLPWRSSDHRALQIDW